MRIGVLLEDIDGPMIQKPAKPGIAILFFYQNHPKRTPIYGNAVVFPSRPFQGGDDRFFSPDPLPALGAFFFSPTFSPGQEVAGQLQHVLLQAQTARDQALPLPAEELPQPRAEGAEDLDHLKRHFSAPAFSRRSAPRNL